MAVINEASFLDDNPVVAEVSAADKEVAVDDTFLAVV